MSPDDTSQKQQQQQEEGDAASEDTTVHRVKMSHGNIPGFLLSCIASCCIHFERSEGRPVHIHSCLTTSFFHMLADGSASWSHTQEDDNLTSPRYAASIIIESVSQIASQTANSVRESVVLARESVASVTQSAVQAKESVLNSGHVGTDSVASSNDSSGTVLRPTSSSSCI